MSRLQVEIVTERKWKDMLAHPPCEHVNEDNLGYADPVHGKAYVRQTLWPELNKYLLQHEFDHLLEEQGTDECVHGMRHKKGFVRNAAAIGAAPFTLGSSLLVGSDKQRPVVGSPGGTLNKFANVAYQTVPAVAGGVIGGAVGGPPGAALGAGAGQALGSAATGQRAVGKQALGAGVGAGIGAEAGALGSGLGAFGSGALQTAGTALGRGATSALLGQGFGAGATQGAAQGGLTALGQNMFAPGGSSIFSPIRGSTSFAPNVSAGSGTGNVASRLQQFGFGGGLNVPSNIYTPSGSPYSPGGGFSAPPTPPPPAGPTNRLAGMFGGIGNALNKFGVPAAILGPTLLGTGVAGAGQAIGNARQPQIPELSQLPSVQTFSQQGQQQFGDLRTRLQGLSTQALPPDLASPIRRQYNILRQEATGQFKNFRPGADLATDTGYQRLMQDIAQRESESIAQAQLSWQENQRQNIATELGVDSQQLGVLQSIAQLDIDTIMARTGLRAQEAAQLKELFGNLGSTIAGAGILSHFARTP